MLSLVVTIITAVIAAQALETNKQTEKPLIDFLTSDYLSVEQSSWATINAHYDKVTSFSIIHRDHSRFLTAEFDTTDSLRTAILPSAGSLIDKLKLMDSLYSNASGLFLSPESITFDGLVREFRNNVLFNAKRLSEDIFREASRANFWEKGKNFLQFCNDSRPSVIVIESEFQSIYNYYKDVRSALLKGYILTQLSHMLAGIKNKDEFKHRVDFMKRNVKNLLRIAKHDSWICDSEPKAHAEHGYTQVTNFLQGYIDNELNFNN